MKIGIDCRLPYYTLGGITQYILQLLPALARLDTYNDYLLLRNTKDLRTYKPPESINFHSRKLWTPSHHRLEKWTLGLELSRFRLELLHSPDFIPPAFGAGKRIITVHDLNFLYYPQFLAPESRRYYAGQIEWAVRVADHIIADSQHTRRDLIERLAVPGDKVTTVYLAASPIYETSWASNSVNNTLRKYQLPGEFILFVGTLSARKNLMMLVEAYARLVEDQRLDVPLVLAGSRGWRYEEILSEVIRLGHQDRVYHLEGLSDVELAHLYSQASMFVFPSFYEGFGLPPLEAMHCGCPVIASNQSSLPEVVGKAGILLEPSDIDAWAAAMTNVLSDQVLRSDMIKAGRRQAEGFTWAKTAAATYELYQRIG